MKSSDLTYEQLRRLEKSLKPKLVYIRKLNARMMQREFPDRDRMPAMSVPPHRKSRDTVPTFATADDRSCIRSTSR